ncbi:hypothetical protein ACWGKU_28110 [Kitasatospora sp. NPDC054768]
MVGKGAPIPDAESGAVIRVDVPLPHQAVNHELLSRGLVHPAFQRNSTKGLHRIIDALGDTIKLRPRIEDIVLVEK